MVVKEAAVKSHLEFLSAGFRHQTTEVKAFFFPLENTVYSFAGQFT